MSDNYYEYAMKYRENLITKGELVNYENPDRLTLYELQALTSKIFSEIDKLDCSFGYMPIKNSVKKPFFISDGEQLELFNDFLDWYQVMKTPNMDIIEYVTRNYPAKNFPRVLCVGDGRNSHLGRMLAMRGYKTVSVDPEARKEFSGKIPGINGTQGGSLHVVKGEFYKTSTPMIDWASIIVGSKIPMCAEDLIETNKPVVFSLSKNAEIHNIRFKGVPITSERQLYTELMKCEGVQVKKVKILDHEREFFVRDGRERDR